MTYRVNHQFTRIVTGTSATQIECQAHETPAQMSITESIQELPVEDMQRNVGSGRVPRIEERRIFDPRFEVRKISLRRDSEQGEKFAAEGSLDPQ